MKVLTETARVRLNYLPYEVAHEDALRLITSSVCARACLGGGTRGRLREGSLNLIGGGTFERHCVIETLRFSLPLSAQMWFGKMSPHVPTCPSPSHPQSVH